MTIIERIQEALHNVDYERDSINKLIAVSYYIGLEEATRRVADAYTAHIAEQHKRAMASRYYRMAYEIVGPEDYLYMSDYSCIMTETFGADETEL